LLRFLQVLRQCRSTLPQISPENSCGFALLLAAVALQAGLPRALTLRLPARHLLVLEHSLTVGMELAAALEADLHRVKTISFRVKKTSFCYVFLLWKIEHECPIFDGVNFNPFVTLLP